MKWIEIPAPQVSKLAKELQVVLLPMGSIESHGPHMPSGVDAYTSEGLALEAAKIEKAVVLPPLFYNAESPGKTLPGSNLPYGDAFISFPPSLVKAILRQLCLEVARIGFSKMLVVAAHGPSQVSLNLLQYELQEEALALERTGEKAPIVTWLWIGSLTDEAAREVGLDTHHGGGAETALTAACAPGLVDLEMARTLAPYDPQPQTIPGLRYIHNWQRTAPYGYQGDPAAATIEKGKYILEAGAKKLAALIRRFKEYDLGKDV